MDIHNAPGMHAFEGAILTGGYARRMGCDKALLKIAGIPMSTHVARAMLDAGAMDVFVVGGDAETLGVLGLRIIPDHAPHEGPLAGVVSAIHAATEDIVVVTACDMPGIRASHVTELVGAIGQHEVAMSVALGEPQPLHSAWKRSALKTLEERFLSGERSVLRVIRNLDHSTVDFGAGSWSVDLDTPADVISFDPEQH